MNRKVEQICNEKRKVNHKEKKDKKKKWGKWKRKKKR